MIELTDNRTLYTDIVEIGSLKPGDPFELVGGMDASLKDMFRIGIVLNSEGVRQDKPAAADRAKGHTVFVADMSGGTFWCKPDMHVRAIKLKVSLVGHRLPNTREPKD